MQNTTTDTPPPPAVIVPERLAQLDEIRLDAGNHPSFESGHCAMEVVAWLAGLGHTDAPECASPVLRAFTIRLNDYWSAEQRQALKPYLPRMVGTAGDGKDPVRQRIALAGAKDLMVPWLNLAGLTEHATAVTEAGTEAQLRTRLREARDAAWAKRNASCAELKTKILEHLKEKGAADAAADADADAAAAAVAAAAAAAVAVAVAVAVAAAVAAAAAVAVAAAAAVAAAVAVAAAAAEGGDVWFAAYNAARDHFKDNPLPIHAEIKALGAAQAGQALDLLDRLIVAVDVPAVA